MKKYLMLISTLVFGLSDGFTQNDRIKDHNTIVWPQLFVNIPLGEKWQLLPEYQWRRTEGLEQMQQSLLRVALQRTISTSLNAAVGYGWIETFEYGDYPLAANGTFPEHRIFEQLQLRNNFGPLSLLQRLRIEQRWVGRVNTPPGGEREVEEWWFSHRFRMLARLQYALSQKLPVYLVAADEVFLGAGKNVGANTFDQNRIMLALGARFSKHFAVEAGYINQTVFQGRRMAFNTIVQDNNGLTLALFLNF